MESLVKNSFYNVGYKCLNVLFPLISSAYVARILMADGIGKVSSAQNIVTYFIMIASLGLPTYGVKKTAECSNRKELSKTFSELFTINLISSTICIVLYYTLIAYVPFFFEKRLLFFIVGLSLILNIFNVDWFYQGREEYKYIMMRSLWVKIISLILIFVFVKTAKDYNIYALIQTSAIAFNYFFNIVHIRKYVDFSFKNINIIQHLKPVIVLLASTIAIEIYTLTDTTMLSFICGDKTVGYYSMAMKALNIVKMMVSSVIAVFLPRLSYLYINGAEEKFLSLIRLGFKIILGLAVPAVILLILQGDELVILLFGSDYLESITTLRILAISVLNVSLSGYIGAQILITIGKEKWMFYSTITGAIINIVLNFVLIPLYSQNGAAIASTITEAMVTYFQIVALRKCIKISLPRRFYISIIIQAIGMVSVIILSSVVIRNMILRLLVTSFLGGAIYIILGIIFRNEFIIEILNKVKEIVKH